MLVKEKEVITAFLGKTLNIPADEVAALFEKADDQSEVLKADALDTLLEKDKLRVAAVKSENKTHFDNGFKKAQSETLSKFEKDLKEKFGVTEDKQGLDLIDAIIQAKATNSGAETDETKIKSSKIYLDAIDKLKKEKDAEVKQWMDKYDSREKQLTKETTFKTISEKALAYIDNLNPIYGTNDPNKIKNQKQILLNQLSEFEFQVKEDGRIIALKKDGDTFKIAEDEHGHPLSFEKIVKQKSDAIWDYKKVDPRGGTGNDNDDDGNGGSDKGYKGPIPKNEQEYMDLVSKAKSPEEKIQITDVWRDNKPK